MARSGRNVCTESLAAIDLDMGKPTWHFDVAALGTAQLDFERGNMVLVFARLP
ncbi:hypothetical protein PPMP20_00160 [Paraburkholderia phymatum]|uniref:hypothetical protein n=1 Tax=Paraburkholderia phymatum TaxID=148447 RepID=UPI0002D41C6E|nr:hypothetical protein [Paraburkholderia phymatum]